ncbi:eosinophil peroxidase-like [Lytechinus pictus]|uniref:eosinophil peroxidase-like n=1 Tax=Lytechinus pictus TaxID=7653 RepID=UPI0030BA1D7B
MTGRGHLILFVSVWMAVCCILEQTTAQVANLEDNIQVVQKRSLARDEGYYAEDENLEDVADRWRLDPLDLLLQFNSRKRREAIGKRNTNDADGPANAALVEDEVVHGDRVRRQGPANAALVDDEVVHGDRVRRQGPANTALVDDEVVHGDRVRRQGPANTALVDDEVVHGDRVRRQGPANAALVDDEVVHGDRVRRQDDDAELTKELKRLLREERKRKKKLFKELRKERRRNQRRLRKQAAKKRKQLARKARKFNRKEFSKAIKDGDMAVLERMLNIEIDVQINMDDICKHSHDHSHADVTCDPEAIYRTLNGSCNNINHHSWGSTLEPLVRWLDANYSSHGHFLPREYFISPRDVSTTFVEADDGAPDKAQPGVSILMMHWGQFTDHDITHTPAAHDECDCKTLNSSCYPLQIPQDDAYFQGRECFEVPRTLSHCGDETKREQFNEITAFVDASNVYGSTQAELDELRYYPQDGIPDSENVACGWMRVDEIPGHEGQGSLLPNHGEVTGNCFGEDEEKKIFAGEAGDFRAMEQPGLTSLHTLWVRNHNLLADGLRSRNPGWSCDRVFEEARKINGAMMQAIDYNEYLPTLLGTTEYSNYIGDYTGYDPDLNPSISNVFATSGYRQGHSAVDTVIERYIYKNDADGDEVLKRLDPLPMTEVFFNARFMYDFENGSVDGFMQGMIRQQCRKIDRFMSSALLNHLFISPDAPSNTPGLDLLSLNILRGRDNGIQPYFQWRKFCKLSEITGWSDLAKDNLMTTETINKLKETYGEEDIDVQRIDPFIGFIAEEPSPGGTLGPTLSCIIGDQFRRLRNGDRFFYLNPEGAQAFTEAQREAIHKVTMARVLCHNLDKPVEFQLNVFKLPDEDNPEYDCFAYDTIPPIDLDPWCEDPDQCVAKDEGI